MFIKDILMMYNKLEKIREVVNIDTNIYLDDLFKFFDRNNDMIINSKEIILYSSVLYKILENILKIITLILESINIYRTESTRYIYTKCLTRFYNRIYNSISNDLLNSKYYKITNTYIEDLNKTIKDDINNIIPNSNKLQILELINNNEKDNIDPINYDDEMIELENTMRELQKLEDFAKYDTSIIEQRHKIDYFNEYKEYDTFIKKVHGYDKNLNDDLMLTEEEIDSMLKQQTCDL
jgi:hypothetical protein